MAHEITLAYCANLDCGERITINNWKDGGTIHGYPLCPECFRFEEQAEFYRKEVASGRMGGI